MGFRSSEKVECLNARFTSFSTHFGLSPGNIREKRGKENEKFKFEFKLIRYVLCLALF